MTNKIIKARFSGKTVLSGGEHTPVESDVNSGKRDKIEVGDGNATVKMKIKEGRALTVAQRLQRSRAIRRIKPKLQRAAKRSLIKSPSLVS